MGKKTILLIILFFLTFEAKSVENKVFIKKTVNEHTITNIDINNEVRFIIAINPKLAEIDKKKIYKYAENSLINEKIKISELSKFYDLNKNKKLPDEIILNFAKKIGITNINEIKNYLENNNISYNFFVEKIFIEHLWNTLIYKKFNDKININEEIIKKNLLEQSKTKKEKNSYFLNEIIYRIENKSNFELKNKEILDSIKKIGFENTANLHSISNSARFNGKLGWIEENQLSKLIKEEVKKTKIGNYTNPIKIRDGYIILLIKDKKSEKEYIDINEQVKKQIAYERNKKLNEFSRQYFKKVAINQTIE